MTSPRRTVKSRRTPAAGKGVPKPPRSAARQATQGRVQGSDDAGSGRYLLRLYVTGTTPASTRAIERVQSICKDHLEGRYDLEVIDIYQLPALAKDEQIIATPTLIRVLPKPLRRLIGDLSRVEALFFGMDLRESR
jgi:circadian clock protein KaiB